MVVGPVLHLELLLGSRRGRQYVFQFLYAGWSLLIFSIYYLQYLASFASQRWGPFATTVADPHLTHDYASSYVQFFLSQQFILLLIATPTIAAGAISDEKERGTLQYLFSAGLSSLEIVLGKLTGRLLLLCKIFASGLPFLFFAAAFAGITASLLFTILVQTSVILVGLGGASMLASVWAKQTRDAVLSLYALGLFLFLACLAILGVSPGAGVTTGVLGSAAEYIRCLNPVYVLIPGWVEDAPQVMLQRLLWFSAGWLGLGVICIAVAAARLRPAYWKQMEGIGKTKQKLLYYMRPDVAGEPVRWKERYVGGLAPLPILRFVPRWFVLLLLFLGSAALACLILSDSAEPVAWSNFLSGDWQALFPALWNMNRANASTWIAIIGAIVALAASLMVGIRCSGAITGERERNTWEALLMTPMETPQMVRAKLWGIVGATYPYLVAYAIPLGIVSLLAAPFATLVFAIGLAGTWMTMFYVGATGLWCSARSETSWRSLIYMFLLTYVAGAIPYVVLGVMAIFLWFMIVMMYFLAVSLLFGGGPPGPPPMTFQHFFIALCIGLGLCFIFASWFFLKEAEKRVADYDRTRHWRNEPIRRPRVKPKQVEEYEAAEQTKEY